jgi:hypothetical protein
VRHRFGTIWPVVMAHALGNVPVRGWSQAALLLLMVVVVIAARRVIAVHLRELGRLLASRTVVLGMAIAAGVVAVILLVAAVAPRSLLALGMGTLVLALLIEWQERRRSAQPLTTTLSL